MTYTVISHVSVPYCVTIEFFTGRRWLGREASNRIREDEREKMKEWRAWGRSVDRSEIELTDERRRDGVRSPGWCWCLKRHSRSQKPADGDAVTDFMTPRTTLAPRWTIKPLSQLHGSLDTATLAQSVTSPSSSSSSSPSLLPRLKLQFQKRVNFVASIVSLSGYCAPPRNLHLLLFSPEPPSPGTSKSPANDKAVFRGAPWM